MYASTQRNASTVYWSFNIIIYGGAHSLPLLMSFYNRILQAKLM
jgi:hypothetical protein